MSLTRTWKEDSPNDDSFGFELDDYQRRIRQDIRERASVQHQAYLDESGHSDVWEHSPGKCTVVFIGAKGTFPTPATTTTGCIAYATDEGNQQYYWNGAAWVKVQEPVLITGNQTVAGIKTFSNKPVFSDGGSFTKAITSTIATGTAPLTVASKTKCENLNVDQVDGFDIAAYGGEQSYTVGGGLILKMGTQICSSQGDYNVVFGEAFPNGIIAVVSAQQWDNNANPYVWQIRTKTAANFVFRVNAASGGEYLNWLAIGW